MIEIIQAFDETFNLISATKLIRCKDCRYWRDKDNSIFGVPVCLYHILNSTVGIALRKNGDDYCSIAEIQTKEEVKEDLDDKADEESNEVI